MDRTGRIEGDNPDERIRPDVFQNEQKPNNDLKTEKDRRDDKVF
jgi:hypothetical protein